MRDLKCKKCGRVIIRIGDDSCIQARNAVAENIQGGAPQPGDICKVICKCGFHIIGFTSDYLIEG